MTTLEQLIAERDIIEVMHRYAHTMDYGDEAGWVDVFTEDAVFDVVNVATGVRVHREDGRQQLAAYIANYPKPPRYAKHTVVDPIIEVDGDVATARSYWLFYWRDMETGQPTLVAFGRYFDTLVCQEGRWRIKERLAELEATLV
jgi:3-phenylpropionate/cinnamic acid dioxygenase small subunit